MNQSKCLEYYYDSRVYSDEEIHTSIEETKKEFSNKKVYVDVTLNSFGVYVITFSFENKNNLFHKIQLKFKKKTKKEKKRKPLLLESKNREQTRLEKYYGNQYGKYKNTKKYKPF